MSHDQFPSSTTQTLEADAPSPADFDEIEAFANSGSTHENEVAPGVEASRRLGAVALNETAPSANELSADDASEEEIRLREAYRDPKFPNGMKIAIGSETYLVTGVSFKGDNGNYETETVTIQHMVEDGETLTMEPTYLEQWISAAKAQAAAGEQLLDDAEYAEIGTEIAEQYATNATVIRALGSAVLAQEALADTSATPEVDTEALANQLRNWIDEYNELGFSTDEEIEIRGETYIVKEISLASENDGTDSKVTIQRKGPDAAEFVLTPEQLQAFLA